MFSDDIKVSKKNQIEKVKFSSYGEKIACVNGDHEFGTFNFDLDRNSKPAVHVNKKAVKVDDFDFVNRDTIFGFTSMKPGLTTLYDTLLPLKKRPIFQV